MPVLLYVISNGFVWKLIPFPFPAYLYTDNCRTVLGEQNECSKHHQHKPPQMIPSIDPLSHPQSWDCAIACLSFMGTFILSVTLWSPPTDFLLLSGRTPLHGRRGSWCLVTLPIAPMPTLKHCLFIITPTHSFPNTVMILKYRHEQWILQCVIKTI